MPPTGPSHAVLVNPRADRADDALVARLRELVPPEHVFISDAPDAYPALVADLLARGYPTIFTAGGDGTFHRLVNALPASATPRIGVLPLGAGNAVSGTVSGDASDPLTDLRRFLHNPSTESLRLPFCQAEGLRFAFAGLGLDAAALADYRALLRRLGKGPLHRLLNGRAGYLTAVFALTFPRRLFLDRVTLRATNLGAPAHVVARAPDGGAHVVRTVAPGELLYEGHANAAVFGTSPEFGHRYRLLPLAGLDPARFHLRLSAVAPTRLLASLPSLRRGTFTHPGLHDFLVDRVRLEFSEPVPYQLGGDLMGERDHLEIALSDRAVDLVRFN